MKIDLIGKRFGKLLVIAELKKKKNNAVWWRCICDCGNYLNTSEARLRLGQTNSCGCLRKKQNGLSNHKLYSVWRSIKDRCCNKKYHRYIDYGKRGISICDEWKDNYIKFYDWCMSNGWNEELEIDRINNDGSYSPDNCRFINHQENCCNRRRQKNNTTGYRGVVKRKIGYRARVFLFRDIIYDQSGFKTAQDAALARDKYILKNGVNLPLNFPELEYWSCL